MLVRQAMRAAATRLRRHSQLAPRSVNQLVDAKGNGRQDDEEHDDDDGDDIVALCHGDGLRVPDMRMKFVECLFVFSFVAIMSVRF